MAVTKRTQEKTAVVRLVLCKAFLAALRSALTAPPAAVGLLLRFCVRKTVPCFGHETKHKNR